MLSSTVGNQRSCSILTKLPVLFKVWHKHQSRLKCWQYPIYVIVDEVKKWNTSNVSTVMLWKKGVVRKKAFRKRMTFEPSFEMAKVQKLLKSLVWPVDLEVFLAVLELVAHHHTPCHSTWGFPAAVSSQQLAPPAFSVPLPLLLSQRSENFKEITSSLLSWEPSGKAG